MIARRARRAGYWVCKRCWQGNLGGEKCLFCGRAK
ncbi:hypothetical protein SEA_CHILL_47 [Mycobacterium phage Chill]|uniref:Uncharacterized protein n=2 Tax=Plotvirus plot TaxID=2170099 RepID=A0A481VU92_9CAUD|nr:hypothetical protein SEA_CHILL_47 [Mycobacterium phage Chill]QBP30044.1 hypothetical protein SEA_WALDOWHY_47 [Mycobacterium phage WaldoWhy]